MSTRPAFASPVPLVACAAAATILAASCGRGPSTQAAGGTGDAAEKVYVAPGQYDEFYAFRLRRASAGTCPCTRLPSGRLLRDIPVFSQYPEKGWGYSEQTKPMLMTSYGFIPWDDAHHPELSQTDGVPDGRWMFINANNTPRVARISLKNFDTEEIIEIPNSAGNHSSPFVTQNTEYAVAGTRFSVPIPQADVPISEYKDKFCRHAHLHQGGFSDRPDGDRLPDPDAGLRLRPLPLGEGSVARLVVLHVVQLGTGQHACWRRTPRSATRISSRR